ncbi:MAG: 4'-phosphopantetheinyl transferase superfamily protein [Gammaproteobacteria bacterium]
MNRKQNAVVKEDSVAFDSSLLDSLRREAHVWFAEPAAITETSTLARYKSMLSPQEIERHSRFRYATDRQSYLVSHALVRRVLSQYAGVDPAQWRFSSNQYGRPEISGPNEVPPLRFNLTHTNGLVACLVTLSADCGVDAERISARANPRAVARKMFAETEQRELDKLDGDAFMERFFSYWTLREAYCKARGVSIFHSGKNYFFETTNAQRARIKFDTGYGCNGNQWQFCFSRPTAEHIVAIAIRASDHREREVVCRPIVS